MPRGWCISDLGGLDDGSLLQAAQLQQDGLSLRVLSLGASLQDLRLTQQNLPLVLGYEDAFQYQHNPAYLGSMVGRCANRINGGICELLGQRLQLSKLAEEPHHLHGGPYGSAQRNWQMHVEGNKLVLEDELADGHMGYPGKLNVKVTFEVIRQGCLELVIEATSEQATLCNFTPHWYFNLGAKSDLGDHTLKVAADSYLATENNGIPKAPPESLDASVLDLRHAPNLLPSLLNQVDHNYCLASARRSLTPVAWLKAETSGVSMGLATTEPGLQVYGGAYLDVPAKQTLSGKAYLAGSGVALEPQAWPDAPNQTSFPSILLLPGELYRQQNQYQFSSQ